MNLKALVSAAGCLARSDQDGYGPETSVHRQLSITSSRLREEALNSIREDGDGIPYSAAILARRFQKRMQRTFRATEHKL